MGLNNLLSTLEKRDADTPDTLCSQGEVSAKPASMLACTLDTPDTQQNEDGKGNETSFGWLLHYPTSDPVQVFCLPEPTHAEALAMYPDALAAEPIPERTSIKATPEQEVKLGALVAALGAAYAFTDAEQQEALALALNDPDAALGSYRLMAAECNPVIAARSKQGIRNVLLQNLAKSYPLDTREEVAKIAGISHDTVPVTLAICNKSVCELAKPINNNDPFKLLELVERHKGVK